MFLEASAALAGLSLYSFFVEPHRFTIRHKSVHLKGPDHAPLSVLHLSDFHFYKGKIARKKFLHRLAQRIQEKPVDFIFITGDLIDDDSGIDLCIEALRPLKAKYGVYAVLGNHDYIHVQLRDIFTSTGTLHKKVRKQNDVERLVRELAAIGVTVLRNERLSVDIEGAPVTLVGIDDPYIYKDDIPKAFAGFQKNGPCLVLVHSPERYREIAENGADMVFSGHTHGGQIRIPGVGPVVTRSDAPREYCYGLNRLNGTTYYTTCGLGVGRITHVRLFCRPEVVFFQLHFGAQNAKSGTGDNRS